MKHCGNSDKDEDNSPKTFNDKNHHGSSQKSGPKPCIMDHIRIFQLTPWAMSWEISLLTLSVWKTVLVLQTVKNLT